MIDIFLRAAERPTEFFFCLALALIPTVVWFLIFGPRHRGRWGSIFATFCAGMLAGAIILSYQFFWGARFDLIFFVIEPNDFDSAIRVQIGNVLLSSLLVFLSVGFLEEYAKHWVVKKVDHNIFESIDDVIEFSIIGALGFAFLENAGYFFLLMVRGDMENLVTLFVVRSIFVVFIHILCSGIYGYFYGLGYFAKPVLSERVRKGKTPALPFFLHRIANFRPTSVFRDEMVTVGLLLAMTIHGAYDFLLEIGTLGQFASLFTEQTMHFSGENIQIHWILLPMILVFGFSYLSYLLNKKEHQVRYGHLETHEVFVPQT
ncbi:PrsW family intramembrane metalloprotease [Candidatus Peregrinibacteria bacterium]|nr:MAG: PrsW family intramembrane metalloprotease [Candidatus Peregrinibacteria bacterium]